MKLHTGLVLHVVLLLFVKLYSSRYGPQLGLCPFSSITSNKRESDRLVREKKEE